MPSLPELEVYKRTLGAALVGQVITEVDPRDFRVVRAERERLDELLVGQAIGRIDRYGKWLVIEVGGAEQLVLHLGLTGKLKLIDPEAKLPRFAVFALQFDGGERLVLADQRKIGKVYARRFDDIKAEKGLGPDLLEITKDEFTRRLAGKRRGIHDVLMDQKVIAGIGGKYADEVLWQAKIHPHTKVDQLAEAKRHALYVIIMKVTRRAIELDADMERFPSSWLIPHRRTDQICPRCAHPLIVHGSVFHCPVCQPAPNPYRRG
jgi:formamidopyrimidine-DNA glycosylase